MAIFSQPMAIFKSEDMDRDGTHTLSTSIKKNLYGLSGFAANNHAEYRTSAAAQSLIVRALLIGPSF